VTIKKNELAGLAIDVLLVMAMIALTALALILAF